MQRYISIETPWVYLRINLPAIVVYIPVTNWHTHINHNILTVRVIDYASEHLPRMQEGITLQKTIQRSISWQMSINVQFAYI